jgi:hypothetical protein
MNIEENKLMLVLWRINPLLGKDSVNTSPRKNTGTSVGRPLLGNGLVNKPSQH